MVDTYGPSVIGSAAARIDQIHVHEREPVVLLVVREERYCRDLVLDIRPEHGLVPREHLLEATTAVRNVHELRRPYRHDGRPSRQGEGTPFRECRTLLIAWYCSPVAPGRRWTCR